MIVVKGQLVHVGLEGGVLNEIGEDVAEAFGTVCIKLLNVGHNEVDTDG